MDITKMTERQLHERLDMILEKINDAHLNYYEPERLKKLIVRSYTSTKQELERRMGDIVEL